MTEQVVDQPCDYSVLVYNPGGMLIAEIKFNEPDDSPTEIGIALAIRTIVKPLKVPNTITISKFHVNERDTRTELHFAVDCHESIGDVIQLLTAIFSQIDVTKAVVEHIVTTTFAAMLTSMRQHYLHITIAA